MEYSPLIIFLGLFVLIVAAFIVGKRLGRMETEQQLEPKLSEAREDAIKRSRAVLSGQFSEQLAPFLPHFPYKPTEARFIGKPVDFIVFKGMDNQQIEEVVFVEVKSGSSQLSTSQRKLKDTITQKKVSWEEYHVSSENKEKIELKIN